MPHKPTRTDLALIALSWALAAFTLFVAIENWSGTPR